MALLSYDEVRPWAKAIKEEVLERRMPPWGAVKGFGRFASDSSLGVEEIHLIADWVEGGAPEGNPELLPHIPVMWPNPPKEQPGGSPIPLQVGSTLQKTLRITAIRAENLPEKASMKVVATLPGGRIQPLIWLENFQPKSQQVYRYAEPLDLPAGTRISTEPTFSAAKLLVFTTHKRSH